MKVRILDETLSSTSTVAGGMNKQTEEISPETPRKDEIQEMDVDGGGEDVDEGDGVEEVDDGEEEVETRPEQGR